MSTSLNSPFSEETTRYLGDWLSGGKEVTSFPYTVQRELAKYQPFSRESVRLYRCSRSPLPLSPEIYSLEVLSNYTSWTYDLQVAQDFCEGTEDQIITSLIPPGQFLLDTTLLPAKLITRLFGGFPEEKEVIVKPGTYFVKLVE